MKTDPDLWQRLEHMTFDEAGAPLSAARRLARENGWSPAFAEKVIDEYRRFAYLAVVAGHEVTPSDEVDQAWHLHLTYTRHYWGDFAQMLGTPLHHGPTRGTGSDKVRYEDNYAATLASYEREFGETPPADIWPAASIRFGEAPFYQRVNTRTHLVIPMPRALSRLAGSWLGRLGLALASLMAATGLSVVTAHAALKEMKGELGPVISLLIILGFSGIIIAALIHIFRDGGGKGGGSGCAVQPVETAAAVQGAADAEARA
ncbi:hypothetical protein FF098_011320 [Parvularcula flava]|uniref:Uncharacterized protein n=1 Tax=Aquisalinus luteolus TaxID=1566827 RepID=A0A8J3A4V1_9PROT|nr:hypothetical protein [Aquisalinus luteolus]NHK28497.1 hypothetical protein [Aquisalinus luteolus]GGH98655.1 hypothetical protein GCM10011355_22760 [Aquisalinus luteolus]